ncbi:NAD(P)(+) transhydrogenase (Re/Si-specific) subunit beta [Kamptonema cortianum]|nr:NAD(P)(+) transhydrogenase (Re/Si-specific) subunit beta [Oscillatoria laete-virens]MDK3159552.1 NAD(P)(+) transhydrogenase (Re/Si-specific) subunit beta [Kamptonema cortianum]MDL5053309.1 NAD(P)(+) transhydrogenase (Re/Si-specific) subunit beta [Oscillatoria laete-virens NRMC-F 0139]
MTPFFSMTLASVTGDHPATILAYTVAAVLFVMGLKMLGKQATARKGNLLSSVGMLVAIVAALINAGLDYRWIAGGMVAGSVVGAFLAMRVKMTGMPEMVALLNGLGGLASFLVGWAEYHKVFSQTQSLPEWSAIITGAPTLGLMESVAIYFAVIIGGVTFTGSLVAYLKLSEKISGKPFIFSGQRAVNILILLGIILAGVFFCMDPAQRYPVFIVILCLGLILGIMAVAPIGGADMPVVISLLNSYSGIAAAAAGFIIGNSALIVTGSLVGASGIILTSIMCKAMNRSLANVLFSGFGSGAGAGQKAEGFKGEAKAMTPEDAFFVLESAKHVVVVPGYGMAVAQAQHVVKELADLLEDNGAEVKFAIHPVAGRMPGHMNVLLAEADVPYEQLVEMDAVNPIMDSVDVAIVIGANDVVNPAAREAKGSPIYGMPIINVDQAKNVFVLKRSLGSGFAGVDNPLFFKDNTRMIFGDAKGSIQTIVAEFKAANAAA